MTTLEIDVLRLEVKAATTHERVERLTRFIEQSVAERMPQALAAYEEAAADGGTGEVFIERLDVDCSVSAASDPDAIARALAARVHQGLNAATQAAGYVAFRDRAEYVAALLIALADGVAWNRWWFEPFAGLAPLSVSNALRTVVLDDGETGIAALARLTEHDAHRITGCLTTHDARRLLDQVQSRVTRAAFRTDLLWRQSARLRSMTDDPGSWLAALIDAERAVPGSAGAGALAQLRAFHGARDAARRSPMSFPTRADETPHRTLQRWFDDCGIDPGALDAIDARTADAMRLELSQGRSAEVAAPTRSEARWTYETRLGGALLLRVVLARLGWQERWAQACAPTLAASLLDRLAWMIVAKAIAPRDWLRVLADPALQLLAAVPGTSFASPRRLLAQLPTCALVALRQCLGEEARTDTRLRRVNATFDAAADELLRAFGRRLPGCADASADWLRANLLAFPASIVADHASIDASVGRAPLDILLTLAGWRRTECRLADGRLLRLHEANS